MRADVNNDGVVTADEVANVIVPILFGVAVRADSYRPHLEKILSDAGFMVSLVGTSCQACEAGETVVEKDSVEHKVCVADTWLAWHGCDDGYKLPGFLGFWGWSAEHVLRGHPNQPQRGTLSDWLGVGTLAYDVALVHLGTNDLAAHRAVEEIIDSIDHIARLLHQVLLLTRRCASQLCLCLSIPAAHVPANPPQNCAGVTECGSTIRKE